ncbi:folylpolyglutamate synthase/dihydrofolate synthase family protein [Bacteroides sp. 51]|uniref:bifunctional folylpolyglutamate synthase/dihydrofolate synthase n=1 Tax=Bacteroides sp. 51 TaxID=2302938 RepID=UPI0013D287D8|nr:folylpolyglutamate synthase/dihydrofolate synthase family protein [Bacteroides sp. 51]NDV84342.1 bifunctional folylpolyglutamate synthase/dihydrofolate synthase [Bacteroides sp. 51]
MDYLQTLDYLYNSMPMFQQIGSKAYKEGLENTYALDEHFNHPHRNYKTIHIAGTNGKGTCSHTLAAILQSAGYKVGLYTSPHLVDFRERIRVNGEPIPKEYVVQFVKDHRVFFEPLYPSFFELTTAMAFLYFSEAKVDIAVIETGLGGRLDCTNIIQPDLSLITNISLDHTQLLGDTLSKIAFEKAGIIKTGVPVVIGEATPETIPVFIKQAKEKEAPIYFAQEERFLQSATVDDQYDWIYQSEAYPNLRGELHGLYQLPNTNTLLSVIYHLIQIGYPIKEKDVRKGFGEVSELTRLMGRWQKLQNHPTLICDTGHNVAGISFIVEQLKHLDYKRLHMIIGMVDDKDIHGVLTLLPTNATYYFTKATVKRALPENELKKQANTIGLQGEAYPDVVSAVKAAQKESLPEDLIFVGGSSFIVADLLSNRDTLNLY